LGRIPRHRVNVLSRLRDAEAVVVASGSCGAMLKVFYPELFAKTPHLDAARSVSARTWEFSDFLVTRLGVSDVGARFPARVTFHDGCHGLRELGIKQPPRVLLSKVRDIQLLEMKEAETCCGFGGAFAAKFPMISTAMGEGQMRLRRRNRRRIHRLQRLKLPHAHPGPPQPPGQTRQNHPPR